MAGLSKQYVYLAVIAVLLLLWSSSAARAEKFQYISGNRDWIEYRNMNVKTTDGATVKMGTVKSCKDAVTANPDEYIGFTIKRRKGNALTKCWLLPKPSSGTFTDAETISDKSKTLWVTKAAYGTYFKGKAEPAPTPSVGRPGGAYTSDAKLMVELYKDEKYDGLIDKYGASTVRIDTKGMKITSMKIPAGLKVKAEMGYLAGMTYQEKTWTADVENVGDLWNDKIEWITVSAA